MAASELTETHGMRPEDFDSIRDAVMETPRGRWFLGEYASRLRSAETTTLLTSMKRLESAVTSNHDALMSRLSQALAREPGAAPATTAPQPDLAARHLKFFKQDEEIFEPAQAKPAAIAEVPKAAPKVEAPKGAKVVFRRTEESSVAVELPPPAAAAVETPVILEPAPAAEVAQPAAAEAQPKRRIVIIRHKPGEQIDVPLQNEVAEAS
jgi:hypothetical protein